MAIRDNTIALKELRENMETYISRLNKGETFTVFRRSIPVFRLMPVDDTEDGWERVIDFTEIEKDGVPAEDVLRAIRTLHEQD